MTLERLWLVLAVALPALVSLLVPLPAVDLAYQVRAGDEILRTGVIPAVDTYTFTVAGTPWTDQQWLAQVLLALGFRAGGWELLVVLRAALVSLSIGLLVATAMARGARAADGVDPRAPGLRARGARAGAPSAAVRDRDLRRAAAPGGPAGTATRGRSGWRRSWSSPGPTSTGPSSSPRSSWATRGWTTSSGAGRRASPSSCSWSAPPPRSSTRSGWGCGRTPPGSAPTPSSPARSASGSARPRSPCPGLLFYLSAAAALVLAVRGRAALRWPDWLFLAVAVRDRRLGGPRPRLVAVRGGLRARRPAGRAVACAPVARAAHRCLSPPGGRRGPARRAGGRRPAVVAPRGPDHRPHRDPLLRAVGDRRGAPHAGARRAPACWRPRPGPRSWNGPCPMPATSSTPASSCSRRRSGRTERRSPRAAPPRTRSSPGGAWTLLVLPAGTDLDLTGWTVVYEDADGAILARRELGVP